MDNNTLTTAGLATTFTVLAGFLYKVYMVVNHKRIRSNCCGKTLEASLDIEETTPPSGGFNKRSSPELNAVSQRQLQVQMISIPPLNLGGNGSKINTVENPMRPKLVTP